MFTFDTWCVHVECSRACTVVVVGYSLGVPTKQMDHKQLSQSSAGGKALDKELQHAMEAASGPNARRAVGADGQVKRDYKDWQWDNNWDWDFVHGRCVACAVYRGAASTATFSSSVTHTRMQLLGGVTKPSTTWTQSESWRCEQRLALRSWTMCVRMSRNAVRSTSRSRAMPSTGQSCKHERRSGHVPRPSLLPTHRAPHLVELREGTRHGRRRHTITPSLTSRRSSRCVATCGSVCAALRAALIAVLCCLTLQLAQAKAKASNEAAGYQAPTVQLASFEHVPGAKMCESLYRHYRLPDGRLVHMYLTDQLHEQVTGLADPHLPPPLILDDLCQVRVPPPPPPPRVVHDNSKATGRRGSYTVSALHAQRSKLDRSSSSKGSGALAVLAGVAGAKAAMRWRHSMRVRACVVLPYRFKAPLSISPDTFGPAPPLPQDDPPLFIVVRHRRRYRHKDLKGELAKQAALFRQRKKVLLQQHVVTRNNSKRYCTVGTPQVNTREAATALTPA